ncbi:MAG: TauD/TfdA family dioxygenase [Myxococcota bacterium]|nr:TauD/TfdA family dioxygenase [Myxococcota bacterium]
MTRWVAAERETLDAELRRHGALLFRGFPLASDRDFDALIRAFDYPNFRYAESLSNAVRVNRTERVFTANEAPPSVTITLHHEMAQTPVYPSRLFFFCEKPAEQGGATSLCRSDRLFEALEKRCPGFAADCEKHGLLYSLVMPPEDDPESGVGRSWRSTFGVAERAEAEARMRRLGYTWEWLPDDCLRTTTPVLPAVRELGPGRKSFFNQLIAARAWQDRRNEPARAVTLGDGRPLDPEAWALVGELADGLAVDLDWQQGDVALVDNLVVMHGRRRFSGTRAVLASLVAAEA